MKTRSNIKKNQASTFLACLCIALVIGSLLGSYLVLTLQQYASVIRSEYWNKAISVSEAGIEDGLQMVNKYSGDWPKLDNWSRSASLAEDNWSPYSNNCYSVTRTIGDDSYACYIITTNPNAPTVVSTAVISFPYLFGAPLYAAVGLGGSDNAVLRQISVGTRKDPLFNVAMAALYQIDLKGNNIQTDSFDSSDPNYSSNGVYVASRAKSGGDVVTDGTIINTLNVGNATINGRVKTGPGGTVAIGPNGAVGDKAFTDSHKGQIQPGWSSDDMNVKFPDVDLPDTTWQSVAGIPSKTIDGVTYKYYFLNSGDYELSDLSGGVYVAGIARVRLHVTGDYSMSGQDMIRINRTNGFSGKLEVYASGSFKVSGNGIVNVTGDAANFAVYGLPSCTSVTLSGNASFTGLIYAPSATLKLGGGGNDTYDFVGSSISKNVQMNGHFNFHYDENLRNTGPGRGYIPSIWLETKAQ